MTRRITRTDRDGFDMGGLAHAPTFPGTRQFGSFIEQQEARGQQELVQSEQFPTDAPIAELEALGFTFGPVDERDPLFRPATLPEGWSRRGTEHSMHSEIVDEKGRKRVGIFYKAAFYDRSAHAHIVHPASVLSNALYEDDEPTSVTLDDLLTAEVARDWLDRTEADVRESLEMFPGAERYQQKLDRVHRLRVLVEAAS